MKQGLSHSITSWSTIHCLPPSPLLFFLGHRNWSGKSQTHHKGRHTRSEGDSLRRMCWLSSYQLFPITTFPSRLYNFTPISVTLLHPHRDIVVMRGSCTMNISSTSSSTWRHQDRSKCVISLLWDAIASRLSRVILGSVGILSVLISYTCKTITPV